MKPGDAVYFKVAQSNTHRKTKPVMFKGMGFGVFLGHVPPFQKEPPTEHLLRLMGTIGFLTFDMVAEFLGKEAAETCVKKFEDQFYPQGAKDAVVDVPKEEASGPEAAP